MELRIAIKKSGLKQEEIAGQLNIGQARVSRLLAGQFVRWGGDIKRLCEMFRVGLEAIPSIDASQSETLLNALNRNWDGTAEHAQILARMIDNVCEATRYGSLGK